MEGIEETNTGNAPEQTSRADFSQKKEWARELYIRGEVTQKEIANKVGASEQAIVRWVKEGEWDAMRKTKLSTKQNQLKMMYDILDGLNKEALRHINDDDPETNPNSDAIIKITNAIHKLEKDTGIGEMIDTATALINFIQKHQPAGEGADKVVNKWFDIFIKDKLKTIA